MLVSRTNNVLIEKFGVELFTEDTSEDAVVVSTCECGLINDLEERCECGLISDRL